MNRKEVAILSLISFATVVVWILFGLYHARNSDTISDIQMQEIIPLTPAFDNDIINKLQERDE